MTIHRWSVPHYLNPLKRSWPSDRLVVSLISGQRYFTFLFGHIKHNIHNREGARKENKLTRTWISSKRKKGEYDTSLAFKASVGQHKRVFERNSYRATRDVDSFSHVANQTSESTGPSSHFLDRQLPPTVDCSLLLITQFCRLPHSVPSGTFLLSSSSGLMGNLVHQNRQRNLLTGTHTHRNECHPSCHISTLYHTPFPKANAPTVNTFWNVIVAYPVWIVHLSWSNRSNQEA